MAPFIRDARLARGLGQSEAAPLFGVSQPTLSAAENGKTRLSGPKYRQGVHALSFGTRSAIEQEHDMDPHFLVLGVNEGASATVLPDDADRIPVFASANRAELTAEGLRELEVFDHVVVAPTWGSGVSELILRNRFPNLNDLSDDGAAAATEDVVSRAYLVEAASVGAEHADAWARELPARMIDGMGRRLQRELGVSRDQLQAWANELAGEADASV